MFFFSHQDIGESSAVMVLDPSIRFSRPHFNLDRVLRRGGGGYGGPKQPNASNAGGGIPLSFDIEVKLQALICLVSFSCVNSNCSYICH